MKMYGDVRTTGRQETASQRKHRKRNDRRDYAQGNPFVTSQCQATTKKGAQCRKWKVAGSRFCTTHQ